MEIDNEEMEVSFNGKQDTSDESSDEQVFTKLKKRATALHDSDNDSVKSNILSVKDNHSKSSNRCVAQKSLNEEMDVSLNGLQHRSDESSDEEVFTKLKRPKSALIHDSDNDSVEENYNKSSVKGLARKSLNELMEVSSKGEQHRSNESSDEEVNTKLKKRTTAIHDSDNDSVNSNMSSKDDNYSKHSEKEQAQTSQIISDSNTSDAVKSDARTSSGNLVRLDIKRNKLKQKFHKFLGSKEKTIRINENALDCENTTVRELQNSSSSETENVSSIDRIKKKIKARNIVLKSTIYDPDTSDDENAGRIEVLKSGMKQKHVDKSAQRSSKMTAKQAMENMQKIKSEANRMLREKEVTIPYHRPKALSLKDIMNRRTPALGADGKALPIKMNNAQLKQYAELLAERQKEMIQLCKSDTEDEEENNDSAINDTVSESMNKSAEIESITEILIAGLTEPTQNNIANTVTSEQHNASQFVDIEQSFISCPLNHCKITESACVSKFPIIDAIEVPTNLNSREITSDITSAVSTDNIKDNTECSRELNTNENTIGNCPVKSSESITLHENEIDPNTKSTEEESQLIMLHYESEKIEEPEKEPVLTHAIQSNEEKPCQESVKPYSENNDDVSKMNIVNEESVAESKHTFDDLKDLFDDSDNDIDMQDLDKIIKDADDSQHVSSPMLIKEISLSSKPKITGAPGMVIDLDGTNAVYPKKLTGVELLKERFTFFAKLKTPDQIKRECQTKIKPGTAHSKLKHELEEQMAEQRSLEWSKRMEDDKQQKEELDAIRGDGTDDEDIDKIEAKLNDIEDNNIESSESSTESECEENDVDLTEKPKKKSSLIADEADESDGAENEDHVDDRIDTSEVESSDTDSSDNDDSGEERQPKKKGRILKAYEDSDEENENMSKKDDQVVQQERSHDNVTDITNTTQDFLETPKINKSISEDIFASQDTPSFEINDDKQNLKPNNVEEGKLHVISETQPDIDDDFDAIAGMCTGRFADNIVPSEEKVADTQELGEDVLALCTGKFYDSEFIHQENDKTEENDENAPPLQSVTDKGNITQPLQPVAVTKKDEVLDLILDELNEPNNEKPRKYFTGSSEAAKADRVQKKRFVIDSDEEESPVVNESGRKKKLKKKKLRDRALQLTDDEDSDCASESPEERADSDVTALDDVTAVDEEALVEYDSEENEVQPGGRRARPSAFLEQEAELSSEDEWAGSGDEDEAGLDRMEREAGDDDHFHQGRLRRELGQIHMRDVLDQDKREVRLLQELLLEDGDLGGGGRQRNFRWAAVDGEEAPPPADGDAPSQSVEELESEEQWRRQRHEREVFLREMRDKEAAKDDPVDISFGQVVSVRTSAVAVTSPEPAAAEVKSGKDLPSPAKKPFSEIQHKYRGSLLSRGSGTLARLAALATPLAAAADAAPRAQLGAGGSFVFAALDPPLERPKVSKRKQPENMGTPRLLKKLKTEDKTVALKSSLMEHLK